MDQDRFDRIARALGAGSTRRAGLRAALGGLLGIGLGAATLDADADARRTGNGKDGGRAGAAKRRHECGPGQPCPTGYDCVKQGRKRRCSCSTGVTCAGACCPTGQACQDGACVVPATCVAPGEPCKNVGRPCCDGRTCASGQGGRDDVACYVHKTGACQSTADCVYGTACLDGRCGFDVPPPAATGASCNMDIGQLCADPAATCTRYDGPGAPAGSYCTLPLEYTCSGDPDCTCYRCDWTLEGVSAGGGREARAAVGAPRLACCGPEGYACASDRNCCLGMVCVSGTCQPETTCDVCASGCPYPTIADAYNDVASFPAGSTITIAPGAYVVDEIIVTEDNARSITFRRCGVEGSAAIANPRNVIRIQNPTSALGGPISLVNLDFTGGNDDVVDTFVTDPSLRPRINVVGCSFTQATYTTDSRIRSLGHVDLAIAGSVFDRINGGVEGLALFLDGLNVSPPAAITIARSTFSNLTAAANAGAIKANFGPVIEVTDSSFLDNSGRDGGAVYLNNGARMTAHNTSFRGNATRDSAGFDGGAIYLDTNGTFRASGTTEITGNRSRAGSGIFCDETTETCAGMVSGVSAANVSGNGPGADCQTTDGPVSCDIWA